MMNGIVVMTLLVKCEKIDVNRLYYVTIKFSSKLSIPKC